MTILITVWKKHQYHKHDHTCLYAYTKFQNNLLKPEDVFPFGKLTLHYVVKSMLSALLDTAAFHMSIRSQQEE